MTKLRTLKDLRMEKVFGKEDYMTSEFVLKQEAINWVKEMDNIVKEDLK